MASTASSTGSSSTAAPRQPPQGFTPLTPTATYAQMRATLAEVEASTTNPNTRDTNSSLTGSGGTGGGVTAFNAAHTRAMEELRAAQIALAEAWGRGEGEEADDVIDQEDEKMDGDTKAERKGASTAMGAWTGASLAAEKRSRGALKSGSVLDSATANTTSSSDPTINTSTNPKTTSKQGDSTQRTPLETEAERDIALARKRRAANDRYFERVRLGVVDVVGKLEDVAGRMREVEGETGSLWDGSESGLSGSSSSNAANVVVDKDGRRRG